MNIRSLSMASTIASLLAMPLAQAESFRHDPLRTERMIAPFGEHLRPERCPTVPEDGHITLAITVGMALCNNPQTQAQFVALRAQAASYGNAQSAWFPSVSASVGASKSASFTRSGIASGRGSSSGVSIGYTLFDFGRREYSIEAAEKTLFATGYGYDAAMQGVIAAALQAYYNLLSAQAALEAAHASEQFAAAALDAASLRYRLGQVALSDKLQAETTHAQSVLRTEQADNQLAQAQASLAVIMGLRPDVFLVLEEVNEQELATSPGGQDISALMDKAVKIRPDLSAANARYEAARASEQATRRAGLPSISLSSGQSFDAANIFGSGTTRSQSIGVSVSMPIFTGFSQTYSERAAARQTESSALAADQARQSIQQDVWRAWHNYRTTQANWVTSGNQLKSATQLRDVTLGRYREGIGAILDVLNAQSQYSSALQNRVQSKYNVLISRADLVRALGLLNIDTAAPDRSSELLQGAASEEVE